MSTLLRLSIPNLAGVFAIALAPLLITVLQLHPVATPSNVNMAALTVETTSAQNSLDSAVQVELNAAEQVAAIQ